MAETPYYYPIPSPLIESITALALLMILLSLTSSIVRTLKYGG
jgi:hypothetical protein